MSDTMKAIIVLALLLSGCMTATGWVKPGATVAQIEEAAKRCETAVEGEVPIEVSESAGAGAGFFLVGGIWALSSVMAAAIEQQEKTRVLFNECMKSEGFEEEGNVAITVNTTDDELNSDGDCSLREAIQAANTDTAVDACTAGNGADTIIIPAGSYILSIVGAGEDANATGDLDITADLTIIGAGAPSTIIDGNGIDRVFEVFAGATVGISDVTITRGVDPASFGKGGGIANGGALTLTNSTVSDNTARSGGGIDNGGTLTIKNSTISGNTTPGGGNGGGIVNRGGEMTLINSTISGNSATDSGGILNSGGTATLTNVTVADNIGDDAAGITGTLTLKNTIIANNIDSGGFTSDCQVTLTSDGHNLDSDGSCGLASIGDLSNTNPVLGPIADNGGPTQTHALLAGSPAIDAVPVADCTFDDDGDPLTAEVPLATDQRGVARPQGSACDIGAFEFADQDADGVPDHEDNCPTVFNPGQEQTGNNVGGEFGDACVSPDVTVPDGATVEPGAVIEPGVEINNGATVESGAQVGTNATLAKNSTVENDAVVGENVVLNQGSTVGEGAIIGMNVFLNRGVIVDAGAKVGDNSTVGNDSHIFENAVIGCFAAPTSFTPVCPGAALGAKLGKMVTVEADAVVADGERVPSGYTVMP